MPFVDFKMSVYVDCTCGENLKVYIDQQDGASLQLTVEPCKVCLTESLEGGKDLAYQEAQEWVTFFLSTLF